MKSRPLTVYTYAKCSTCRDAVKWLREHGLPFEERPIEKTPPSAAEFRKMLAAQGGNLRKLFNTSGMEYRRLGISVKWDTMTEADAFRLLGSNGMLVKRPFVLGEDGVGLVGFDAVRWAETLHAR